MPNDSIRIFGKDHLVPYWHLAGALLFGFLLRRFFITHFHPYAGDAQFYEELARNWLYHGVYGRNLWGQLLPSDMRMPGYPAFLATIYRTLGRSPAAVMSVQALVDLATCVLTAMIAARLAPASKRKKVATIALWLAALCPFTANYTGVVLTETLATFITSLAMLIFVWPWTNADMDITRADMSRNLLLRYVGWFFLGGVIVGVGTLVRPETPLLLIAVGLVMCARWRRPANWWKLSLAVLWMGVGLILPLAPWASRNALHLGRVQFLSPRYTESPGDYVPRGFYAWTQTWMVKFGDAYSVTWKLGEKVAIDANTLPASAYDSPAELARVAALIDEYNKRSFVTPELNFQFAQLAEERAEAHPVRTYILIPIERGWWLWFTPRIELLPYSGKLWPLHEAWHNNLEDFSVTFGYAILNFIYVGMALIGAWKFRAHEGIALLATFLVVRTVFFTQQLTVEPRYVIVCFPIVLALGALAWTSPRGSTAADVI